MRQHCLQLLAIGGFGFHKCTSDAILALLVSLPYLSCSNRLWLCLVREGNCCTRALQGRGTAWIASYGRLGKPIIWDLVVLTCSQPVGVNFAAANHSTRWSQGDTLLSACVL